MIVLPAVEVIPLPPFEVLFARVIATGLVFVLFAYDWQRVLRQYVARRDTDGSDFRALVKSSLLVIGLLLVFTGAVNAAFFADEPTVRETLRAVGNVLLGMLVVGGLALVASWRGFVPRRLA